MKRDEKEQLDELLDKLLKDECGIEKGIDSTCYIDCPFYINGAYGGECAVGVVQGQISI